MSRTADRVYTAAADLARLEAWFPQLGDGARVAITLSDGQTVHGVVSAVPNLQVFFDPAGNEGMNAVLRLEDPQDASRDRYVWVDQIHAIDSLKASPDR